MMIALLLIALQVVRSVVQQSLQLVQLLNNTPALHAMYTQAQDKRLHLKDDLHRYQDMAGVEELARNNLDMVGPGEVLVRLFQ
jgi:cell division protein FtsB